MKIQKVLQPLLSIILFIIATAAFSAPYKLLHCHQPSGKAPYNIQCLYSVVGQKINEPKVFSKLYVNTNMPYALCANTLCSIDPKKPGYAICKCPIIGISQNIPAWKKVSVGPIFYEISHPKYKNKKMVRISSTFSFAFLNQVDTELPQNKVICRFEEPTAWANCFGKICKVEYIEENGKETPKATCRCPIVKTKSFVTTGVKNEKECTTAEGKVWSAATEAQARNEMGVLHDSYKRFFSKDIAKGSDSDNSQ